MQDLENGRPNRSSGSGKRLLPFWHVLRMSTVRFSDSWKVQLATVSGSQMLVTQVRRARPGIREPMQCWHLYTWTHSLNRIRSVTSSQSRTGDGSGSVRWRRQEFSVGWLKPGHTASAWSASLYGGLGQSSQRAPSGVQGQNP